MIYDKVENLSSYSNIPRINKILEYLKTTDITTLSKNEYEIDGRNLFVRVLRFLPSLPEELKFESHKEYIDVQVVVSGVELMQLAQSEGLSPVSEYNMEGDFQFFSALNSVMEIKVCGGYAAVFFPQDVHRPGCSCRDNEGEVCKLVFKTKIF